MCKIIEFPYKKMRRKRAINAIALFLLFGVSLLIAALYNKKLKEDQQAIYRASVIQQCTELGYDNVFFSEDLNTGEEGFFMEYDEIPITIVGAVTEVDCTSSTHVCFVTVDHKGLWGLNTLIDYDDYRIMRAVRELQNGDSIIIRGTFCYNNIGGIINDVTAIVPVETGKAV